MINNKPFAMFFNASPSKGWNTAKMLEAAKVGAEDAGAETDAQNGRRRCPACVIGGI